VTRPSLAARVLLGLYSVFLALAVFSPTSDRQTRAVGRFGQVLALLHPPAGWITFERLEVLSNLLLIVPFTFLLTLVLPRPSWRDWTAYAFLAASFVELVQALVLPSRHASYSDVVANTAGALVGAALAAGLVRLVRPMLRSEETVASQ
jgi:VanZ family protein